jgi:VanZ family protein
MPKNKIQSFAFAPAIGWGILIIYFSLLPSNELPGFLISTQDVLLHFSVYTGLGVLMVFGANRYTSKKVARPFLLFSVVISFIIGLAIEFIQGSFVDGRHFEWADILFNTLGSLVVFPLNWILKR